MDIAEFKNDENLVKQWKQELETNQVVRLVFEAVMSESPLRKQALEPNETEGRRLGRVEAYEGCLKNFYDCADLPRLPEPFPSRRYGVPPTP